jgi:hypothetical protein
MRSVAGLDAISFWMRKRRSFTVVAAGMSARLMSPRTSVDGESTLRLILAGVSIVSIVSAIAASIAVAGVESVTVGRLHVALRR